MNPYAAVALTAALLTAASAPRTAATNVLESAPIPRSARPPATVIPCSDRRQTDPVPCSAHLQRP